MPPVQACMAAKTRLGGEGGCSYMNSKMDLPMQLCHLNDHVIIQFNMTISVHLAFICEFFFVLRTARRGGVGVSIIANPSIPSRKLSASHLVRRMPEPPTLKK